MVAATGELRQWIPTPSGKVDAFSGMALGSNVDFPGRWMRSQEIGKNYSKTLTLIFINTNLEISNLKSIFANFGTVSSFLTSSGTMCWTNQWNLHNQLYPLS